MRARCPVYLIAFDACDHNVVQAFARDGHLPNFRRMLEHAARCKVHNPVGLFVGAVWLNFATGIYPDRHKFHCWDEIDVASYERRLTTPNSEQPLFWQRLSDSGRRVAILDVPHIKAGTALNGVHLSEWGCHDRHFGLSSWPHGLAGDITSEFGLHPIFGVDAYEAKQFAPDDYVLRDGNFRTLDEDREFLDGIRRGAATKLRLSSTLMAENDWDFFLTVFGDSHGIGHQQWHLHDETHPRFDRATVEGLGGNPLLQVYRDLDLALGELIAQAGEDATVLVLLSHGMGPHVGATHLLDEILARIDQFNRRDAGVGRAERLVRRGFGALPRAMQRLVTAFAVPALRRRAAARDLIPCREFVSAEERARQAYFLEPNNYVYGGIRLNLMGREPRGCVDPAEVDTVIAELTKDLLALVDLDTGRPVVRSVERSNRWHRRFDSDTIPDLFVEYWDWVTLQQTVWSPKTGIVHGLYTNWRSGDHRPDGLLLAMGPDIGAHSAFAPIQVEDLAPTISARLGVTLEDVDGRVVPWLVGRA